MTVLRALCGAWLVPAASLIWIGLATTGLRDISASSQALALGRTQAMAVLLAVFTVLLGASAFVRQPGLEPSAPPHPVNAPTRYRFHLAAGIAAVALVGVGGLVGSLSSFLFSSAALAGFVAGLVLPRTLLRFPGSWTGPLAALSVGMVFQLTIGWLHVIHPGGLASPALIIEGVILAWAAASSARVDVSAAPAAVTATTPVDSGAVSSGFSSPSARPSFAEPMVGH